MVDPVRGGNATDNGPLSNSSTPIFTDADNLWGNGSTSDPASAGVDAHYGIAKTWDFYQSTYGRNGIANDGKGARSFVHDGAYVNASWSDSCFCMRYGDGDSTTLPLVALDVAGHEMSHGVTSRTANLTYRGESGGLNEANSDIFGRCASSCNSHLCGSLHLVATAGCPMGWGTARSPRATPACARPRGATVTQSVPTATLAATCALAALRGSAGGRASIGATRRIPVGPGPNDVPGDPDQD
jgi:hypothetical protein